MEQEAQSVLMQIVLAKSFAVIHRYCPEEYRQHRCTGLGRMHQIVFLLKVHPGGHNRNQSHFAFAGL